MEPLGAAIGTVFLAALAAAVVDQFSKALVTARLADGRVYGWRRVGFRRVANRRLGALALPDGAAAVLWGAALAGAVAALALAPPQPALTAVGIGLSLGGAAGNLIDRLARGAIVDFIVVGRWPTFNLADSALVAGVGLVALSLL